VPALYSVLLWRSRKAIRSGVSTRLSATTAFLSDDYKGYAFWWEPLEMCRKLTLTAWVLLIGEQSEQARVLLALLVSSFFLILHLSIRPLKRVEDGVLMTLVEVALVLVYTSVLLIKACDVSSEVCSQFGFGSSSSGVYLFFLFFGLAMVLLQLLFAAARLYAAGYIPRIILVAATHSVSPTTVIQNVIARSARDWNQRIVALVARVTPHPRAPKVVSSMMSRATSLETVLPTDAPKYIMLLVKGTLCDVHIAELLPRTHASLNVDLMARVIRWGRTSFISLHTVESVHVSTSLSSSASRPSDSKNAEPRHPRIHRLAPSFRASLRVSRTSHTHAAPGPLVEERLPGDSFLPGLQSRTTCEKRHEATTSSRTQSIFSSFRAPQHAGATSSERPSDSHDRKTRKASYFMTSSHLSAAFDRHRAQSSQNLIIQYNDHGGISRLLEVKMSKFKALQWEEALNKLLGFIPLCGPPSYWRWAQACMAATTKRGRTGYLRETDLRSILRRANAGWLSAEALDATLRLAEETELQMGGTPPWLQGLPAKGRSSGKQLDVRRVTGVLLRLCTSSRRIAALFERHSADGRMPMSGWLAFVRAEQLGRREHEAGAATYHAEEEEVAQYSSAIFLSPAARSSPVSERTLSLLQFSLILLSQENGAIAPARSPRAADDLGQPLAHYWIACSHNTYIVGDQLTGRSTADAYRRQLLQGCRHVEIDCWDRKDGPIVTHGGTFCTAEQFSEVARAIAECAFVTSELPVILSLEMHCNPTNQHQIAVMLVKYLGSIIMTYDELAETGRARELSPHDLRGRVLVKGKVKMPKKSVSEQEKQCRSSLSPWRRTKGFMVSTDARTRSTLSCLSRTTTSRATRTTNAISRATRTTFYAPSSHSEDSIALPSIGKKLLQFVFSSRGSADKSHGDNEASPKSHSFQGGDSPPCGEDRLSQDNSVGEFTLDSQSSRPNSLRAGESSRTLIDDMDKARRTLSKRRKSFIARVATDPYYASILALRSVPLSTFLSEAPRQCVLPMTSVNENRFLIEIGLSRGERDVIEGLQTRRASAVGMRDIFGLTEEQLASRAIARLASNPTPEVGSMQRRTAKWLLRPFPLGLRFSGKNMSPLPCWLAGAQNVCLNFSPVEGKVDLAVQLHFALFNGSGGYVLKPALLRHEELPQDLEEEETSWPPPQERLHRTSIEILSLHCLPKRSEQRPRYRGSRGECHKYVPELSGTVAPPDNLDASCPSLLLSVHPIGGFSAITDKLPIPQNVETEMALSPANNGLNASFNKIVHCIAAEPLTTFFRVGVVDGRQEVAFETGVLGRFRHGYRVFQLRGSLGTRIELCYLFVRIEFGSEINLWITPSQIRIQRARAQADLSRVIEDKVRPHVEEVEALKRSRAEADAKVARLEMEVAQLRRMSRSSLST